jgi:hypothetical protein
MSPFPKIRIQIHENLPVGYGMVSYELGIEDRLPIPSITRYKQQQKQQRKIGAIRTGRTEVDTKHMIEEVGRLPFADYFWAKAR